MKRLLTAVALATAALGANAQLTFSGGDNVTSFTGPYNPTGTTTVQNQGIEGATISASQGGTLTATFLGFEALDTDLFAFSLGGSPNLNNKTAVADVTAISSNVAAGTLPFSFQDMSTSVSVTNGTNQPTPYGSYAILGTFAGAVFTPYTKGGLYDLVIGFNDGLRVDADYDDLVVGLRLNPIPEPETYALMLAGLGAIGFIARRRRRA